MANEGALPRKPMAASPLADIPPVPASRNLAPSPARRLGRGATQLALLAAVALLGACERQPSPEAQRIDELNLKIQQLEQRLNTLARQHDDAADRKGKPPAGVIKSLTIRTGSEDDRLRIYWADGSTTDLPCTKEQSTFACG